MDNNQWNFINYGSTTTDNNNAQEQPTAAAAANNKINMNSGRSTFARDERGTSLVSTGMKLSPSVSYMSNLGSYKSIQPDSVYTFTSLVSAPPSHLQHEYQQQPNMQLSASGNGGTVLNWPTLHNVGESDPRSWINFLPAVPSTSNICANKASTHSLSDDLDMTRATRTNIASMKDGVRNSSFQNNAHACSSIVDINLWPATNTNTKPDVHLETLLSPSTKETSAFSGYPRVFCMASSGDLQVSNTGFFGILCSCHGIHLSVSNFCKHSGLSDVNPGSAVRMESGESIAEWRKLYLLQLGIRAPEDHRGWEWPEGLLSPTHSTRSCISGASNGRVFDLSGLFSSSAKSALSVIKSRNSVVTSQIHSSQKDAFSASKNKLKENNREQQKSFLGGCVGRSKEDATAMANFAISMTSTSSCSVASKAHGSSKEGNRQSRSFSNDAIPVSDNLLHSAFWNLQSAGSKTYNILDDGNVLQRQKHSSGTELKLGQPAQHGFGSGSNTVIATKSHNSHLQMSTSQQQLSHNSQYSKVIDNSNLQSYCHPTSGFSRRKEPVQMSVMHNAQITSNKLSCLDQLHDGLSNGTAMSAAFFPSSNSAKGSMHCEERNSGIHFGDPSVSWRLNPQSHFNRSTVMGFSCNVSHGSQRPDINKLKSRKKEERFVGAGSEKVYSFHDSESNLSLNAMQMHKTGFSTRNGRSRDPNSCAVSSQICDLSRVNSIVLDVSDNSKCGKSACNPQRTPDAGDYTQRTMSSACSLNKHPVMQAASAGFSPLTVGVAPGDNSVPLNVNQHSSGDSLKVISQQLDQFFTKTQAITALGLNQQTCSYSDKSELSNSCTVADLRLQDSFMDPGPPGCSRNGLTFNVLPNASKNFMTGVNGKRVGDASKLTTIKGMNTLEASGAFDRSVSHHSETRVQHYHWYQGSDPKEQPSLSLGREENSTTDNDMRQLYSGASISGRRYCAVQAVLPNEKLMSGGASSMDFLKQSSIAAAEYPNIGVLRFMEDSAAVENAILIEANEKVNKEMTTELICFDSLWRDVYPKEDGVASIKCPSAGTRLTDCQTEPKHGLSKFAAVISESDKVSEVFKGKESSKDSSGCSTAATTQALFEDHNFNYHKTGSYDDGCQIKKYVDQGYAIDTSWSSADAADSVKSPKLAHCGKDNTTEEKILKPFPNATSDCLTGDLKKKFPDSKEWKNILDICEVSCGETSSITEGRTSEFAPRKRKRQIKQKSLGASLTVSDVSLPSTVAPQHRDAVGLHIHKTKHDRVVYQATIDSSATFDGNLENLGFEQSSAVSSGLNLSCKRDSTKIYTVVGGDNDDQRMEVGSHDSMDISENSVRQKLRHAQPAIPVKKQVESTECWKDLGFKNPSLQESSNFSLKGCQEVKLVCTKNAESQKIKPVACGKYGILRNEEFDLDQLKPPKLVPLTSILKSARKITNLRTVKEPHSARKLQVGLSCGSTSIDRAVTSEAGQDNQYPKVQSFEDEDRGSSLHNIQSMCHEEDDNCAPDLLMIDKSTANTSQILSNVACLSTAQRKPKKTRMRSLYELSMRGKKFIVAGSSLSQDVIPAQSAYCGLKRKASETGGKHDINNFRGNYRRSLRKARYSSLAIQSEALCCVCGISDKDANNCLLECMHCAIQIHQACYGIAKVPREEWYCRPCKTSSKNAACVLCGYGDGAMTRAFGSKNVVKGLLKAWHIETESNVPLKIISENKLEYAESQPYLSRKQVHNSIVSGLVDSTVKQWVHMVCGLWTPGARCPNVDTMSAFDVSGVSQPKENAVCSLCKRSGGSCIQCRVEDCKTNFHPWCAHQKGLLQSQIEGAGADTIDFFGVCLYHADHHLTAFEANTDTDKIVCDTEQETKSTCARTEGYKGKKQKGGWHSSFLQHNARGDSLVTQVQLDAWLYINKHKLGIKRLPTPPTVDVDHDYKKEYARYKQAKGWKHLVVYKSAIHALGLYTSQFIPRGAMVVEYIGEIVGLRVADKRESEYLCGRRLQYKSACYFFRIDKEQIIDATNKGGIARFVNHSCQPNCVARVITIKNEKKVLFFAQRDICPGEEVTYDYHFNHEDEGKKLPCLCNSRNCRRFLN